MTTVAISLEKLTKRYGANTILSGVDLSVNSGELFTLLGSNGSGKTTALQIISTLAQPSSGKVYINQTDTLLNPVDVRRQIGVVFQESALDRTLSAENNLYFSGALHNLPQYLLKPRIEKLLKLFGLFEKRHVSPTSFSSGMRRALDIVRGILHQPKILLLDEPTVGLDTINRRNIWNHLDQLRKQDGITILMTTHYLEEATKSDRVAFLENGKIDDIASPASFIRALGESILEIETDTPEKLLARLPKDIGQPIRERGRVMFPIKNQTISVDALRQELGAAASAMHIRSLTLDDVYLWRNQDQIRFHE